MYCKDCKFWGKYRKGDCDKEGSIDSGFSVWADALDDSGLRSGLTTKPNFGCIEFSPKMRKVNTVDNLSNSL